MRVLFFAQTKDAAGAAELELNISGRVSVAEFWDRLVALQPRLADFRSTTRVACNGEYATAETRFAEGDEIALIPPVSGG
jgi:molybdopterin converting factor subunit 1